MAGLRTKQKPPHLSMSFALGAIPQLARSELLELGELIEAPVDRHALTLLVLSLRLFGRLMRIHGFHLLLVDQAMKVIACSAKLSSPRYRKINKFVKQVLLPRTFFA